MNHLPAYLKAKSNFDKNIVASSILRDITNRAPPGRFLVSRTVNGEEIWDCINDRDKIISKIKQALRDMRRRIEKENGKNSRQGGSSLTTTCTTGTTTSHQERRMVINQFGQNEIYNSPSQLIQYGNAEYAANIMIMIRRRFMS